MNVRYGGSACDQTSAASLTSRAALEPRASLRVNEMGGGLVAPSVGPTLVHAGRFAWRGTIVRVEQSASAPERAEGEGQLAWLGQHYTVPFRRSCLFCGVQTPPRGAVPRDVALLGQQPALKWVSM